jgi:nitroreductase
MFTQTYSQEKVRLEFFTVLQQRRSVRAYRTQPVEEDKLRRIFEAANLAPSAGNLQAYHVYVFQDKAKRQALARAAYGRYNFIEEAPICLVFCTDPSRSAKIYGERGRELYSVQDATIAGSFAMLAAVDLGLSTVWIGDFDEEAVRKIVGDGGRPVAMFSLGYAAEEPQPAGRRAIEEIFSGDFPQTD